MYPLDSRIFSPIPRFPRTDRPQTPTEINPIPMKMTISADARNRCSATRSRSNPQKNHRTIQTARINPNPWWARAVNMYLGVFMIPIVVLISIYTPTGNPTSVNFLRTNCQISS
jgi:hypothetical protein